MGIYTSVLIILLLTVGEFAEEIKSTNYGFNSSIVFDDWWLNVFIPVWLWAKLLFIPFMIISLLLIYTYRNKK